MINLDQITFTNKNGGKITIDENLRIAAIAGDPEAQFDLGTKLLESANEGDWQNVGK